MDMDNGVRIDYESGRWSEWRGGRENRENCNSINNKTLKNEKKSYNYVQKKQQELKVKLS